MNLTEMNSSDICAALRGRYTQPEWAVFFEVANGTGGNARRHADAVAMNMWPSRGLSILGFEIKVSRNDLIRELKKPAKAEAIAQYCDEWWLAVPKGLILDDDDIPIPWGIMECNKGVLRVSKKAHSLNPKPITKEFMAAVLRSAGKADEATIRQIREEIHKEYQENNKNYIEQEIERRTKRFEILINKIAEFEKATGKSIDKYTDVGELAKNIKLAENIEDLHELLQGEYGALRRVRNLMGEFLKDTENLDTKTGTEEEGNHDC